MQIFIIWVRLHGGVNAILKQWCCGVVLCCGPGFQKHATFAFLESMGIFSESTSSGFGSLTSSCSAVYQPGASSPTIAQAMFSRSAIFKSGTFI